MMMAESRKFQLLAPQRLEMIKEFRGFRRTMLNMSMKPGIVSKLVVDHNLSKDPPKFDSDHADQLIPKLKPICLREMNGSKEFIYLKHILKVTVIDDPMLGFSAFNLIVQDENGDAICVSIYGIPQNQESCEKLGFGTQIGIVHPHYRIAMNGKPCIRVEDQENVVIFGKKKKMCRFCGEENAEKQCAICKRNYCGRECQLADWKKLDHKKICQLNN